MRFLIPLAIALITAGAAAAQTSKDSHGPRTTQCIEVGGQLIPTVCQTPGSRLDTREYICTCPNGGQPTKVAVCAKGETPPPEGKALNITRREAGRDGSLIGDTFRGKPICAPRPPEL
jgi:hypothetical protein